MLKADKHDLARDMRNGTKHDDKFLADLYDCSIATVRKYRRVLHPDSKKERRDG